MPVGRAHEHSVRYERELERVLRFVLPADRGWVLTRLLRLQREAGPGEDRPTEREGGPFEPTVSEVPR